MELAVEDRVRAREALAQLDALLAEDDTRANALWFESALLIEAVLGPVAVRLRGEMVRFEFDKALLTLRAALASNPIVAER